MSQQPSTTVLTCNGGPWHELRLLGLLGLVPIVLLLLQVAPAAVAPLLAVIFFPMAVLTPEMGVVLLLVLVAADVYIQLTPNTGFFASQLLVLMLFVGMILRYFQGRVRIAMQWCDWAVLFFLATGALSIVPASSRPDALKWFLKISTFVMAFFVMRSLRFSEQFLRHALTALTAMCVLTSSYGLYQYMSGGPIRAVEQMLNQHVTQSWVEQDVIRSYSTFRYSLEFATFAILTGSIVLACFLMESRPMRRYLWGAALALVVGALLVSYSRAASIGFALSLFLQLRWSKARLRVIASAVLVLVLVGLVFVHSENALRERASSVAEIESISYVGRWMKWTLGLELVRSHPWLGIGLGNLPLRLPLSYETGEGSEIPNLENLFLTYAAQIGLPGAVALMSVLVGTLYKSVRVHKTSQGPLLRVFGLGIAGGFAAILVNGITDPVLFSGQNSILIFLLLALILGLHQPSKQPLEIQPFE